ncbi:MAG TPA: UDP-N-acetylmuramoyl-L-alanyl-D-glutamate--2,6-diaminopimelate ligase [Mariprofundaceae bacterium]|nr:UDP-N-acetylmuramoyl-L-alanyl-D-glutamate--2,6-diaminopimelate ligase [Mariprofundaceae bacterium]
MTDLDELMTLTGRPVRPLSQIAGEDGVPSGEVEVSGISDDSRSIRPGDAFLCLPRAGERAQTFVEQAAEAGASAIISVGHTYDVALPHLVLDDMEVVGRLLRRWFGTEKSEVRLIGITGTDGKTSVAWMLRDALSRLHGQAWSIGTLGWMRGPEDVVDLGNTTPSLLTMHRLLAVATEAGMPALVCEVSSHGIAQQRIAGLRMDAAIWTNLGHDHLQDHGGFAAYADIKTGFVRDVAEQGGIVICNADADEANARAPETALRFGHGLYRQELSLAWEQELPGMVRFRSALSENEEVLVEDIPLGDFHAENLACVALVLLSLFRVPLEKIPALLNGISAPPGRMQPLGIGRQQIFIDYAHTPEALERCLATARTITRRRLMLVFGCGGERDREKRPEMGGIAVRLADVVWVTSDNPRSEVPEVIASEIVQGMPQPYPADVHLQLDRRQAIADAVAEIESGDVLVIAGKGHETYMEVEGRRLPWSDIEVAAEALRDRDHLKSFKACA